MAPAVMQPSTPPDFDGFVPSSRESQRRPGTADSDAEDKLVLPEAFASREEGIRFCFEYVDKDKSGTLDRSEFRTIASRVNPQKNLAEAELMLQEMDADKDGEVSWEEFKKAFGSVTDELSDEEFMLAVRRNVVMDEQAQEGYLHPKKSRRYLQKTYINAVLSEGLEELIRHIYLNSTELASGELWDEKGFLPRGYEPINTLKYLGTYILDLVKKDRERKQAFDEQERDRLALADLELDRPFAELSQLAKLKLLWNCLMPEAHDEKTKLPMKEMIQVGKALGFPLAVVDEMLERMGYLEDEEEEEQLEFFEFEGIFQFFTKEFLPEEIDLYIMLRLGASNLQHYNNREKAQLIFAKLDEDQSGELELHEIVMLAKMLNPMTEEAQIKKAVEYLDADNSQTVDITEFTQAMETILEAASVKDVDNAITKILEIGVDAVDLATFHMSKDFKRYVTSQPSHKMAEQLGVRTIMEKMDYGANIAFVDVRTFEEQTVSRIKGALSLPAASTSKPKSGWTVKAALKELTEADLALLTGEGQEADLPIVVVYDAAGPRASSVAQLISQKLEGKTVYNMCGGLIEWFNKGGEVVGSTGAHVEALHPFSRELNEFVTRANDYLMPAATAKKSGVKGAKKKKAKK